MNIRSGTFILVTITVLASFCAGFRRGKQPVNVVGSTSIQPFAAELAQRFEQAHPGIRVQVQGGGSTAGIQALANGIADIGTCSRNLSPEEAESFTPILIARDGLAIVVHPSNTTANLTLDQARQLFSGEITNWRLLGGPDRKVTLITREEGSGTREAFMHLVMGKGGRFDRRALVQQSNGSVRELVSTNPDAVGYMSLGMAAEDTDVKPLKIGNVVPTAEAVKDGTYPLARPFLFVVKGALRPRPHEFIKFVLSPEGQDLLGELGLVELSPSEAQQILQQLPATGAK